MDATAGELKTLLEELGGTVEPKMSKKMLEGAVARKLWERDYPDKEFPEQIDPMLAQEVTSKGADHVRKTFKSSQWIAQKKENGMRLVLTLHPDGSTKMTSRGKSVRTYRFSELDDRILSFEGLQSPFEGKTIFDGEVIQTEAFIDTGRTKTTSTLQSTVVMMSINLPESLELQRKYGSLTYRVFDILYLDGNNVQHLPYEERNDLVNTACAKIKELNPQATIEPVETITDWTDAWDTFEEATSKGWEGIMLKNRKAPYQQGKRSRDLLKLKRFQTVDGFITGWVPSTAGRGNEDYIGGFTISSYVDGELREIAAISNITMEVRQDATVYDEDGNPTLNPDYLNRCLELTGQDFNRKSLRLNSARINEWRPDKAPEDCTIRREEMSIQ